MVSQGEKLKVIAEKLINKFGNTIILRKYDAPTYDEWGEPEYSTYTDTTIKGVMDREIVAQMKIVSAGKIDDASLSVLITPDIEPKSGDTVIYSGIEYNIVQIQPVTINDVVILYQLFIAER